MFWILTGVWKSGIEATPSRVKDLLEATGLLFPLDHGPNSLQAEKVTRPAYGNVQILSSS